MAKIPERLTALAKEEVGYQDDNGKSKYFEALFPDDKREMPWCLPYIEWLFLQVFGKAKAMDMLHLIDGEWIYSVPAYVAYAKRAGCWYRRTCNAGWLVLVATHNEWSNHIGLVIDTDSEKREMTVAEGNCNGKVEINTYSFYSTEITGFVRIDYEGSEGEN